MAERHGGVWWHEHRVGHLSKDERGLIHFAYAPEWLDGNGFPVSVSLPLGNGDQPVPAHGFFAGLLPEAGTRQRICRERQLDPADDMGLLLAIGEDCAGALSILPGHQVPDATDEPPAAVTDDQLTQLVRRHGHNLDALTGHPQRFSLAGAQGKLPIRRDGAQYFHAGGRYPSSHILKFETIRRVCFAEFMANRLAASIGLPVVDTEFLFIDTDGDREPYLCVTRYDRHQNEAGELRRLHQEDALQALGEPASMKYQGQGGPGPGEIARLLRAHVDQPALAISRLRDWQLFNYLCGNRDGRAKNIALLYPASDAVPTLAPFYDLVAIEYLNHVGGSRYDRHMALYIGEASLPERIGREDWERMAVQLGIPARPLLKRLEELAQTLHEITRNCLDDFVARHGDPGTTEQFFASIEKRCRWVLQTVLRAR